MVGRRVYARGTAGVELGFLMSCALWLLDRRYEILGVRYPVEGTRFDLVARCMNGVRVLVEAKYRSGRTVRPSEVREFRDKLEEMGEDDRGVFMTNSRFSRKALRVAEACGLETVENVPLVFRTLNR